MRWHIFMSLGFLPLAAASAQSEAVFAPLNRSELTAAQTRTLEQITSRSTTLGEVELVRINPGAFPDRGQITVPLPGSTVTIAAKRSDVKSSTEFSIIGQTAGFAEGTTSFAVNGASVTGSIRMDGRLYRIQPLGDGAHAVFQAGNFPPEHR